MLIEAHQQLCEAGRRIGVVNVGAQAAKVLELTGVREVFIEIDGDS
jgi:anti-anti-sigma regulatory factor